ncbi:MAG: helicase [marine bacterium B5-7]|nr:MAG: helicase [marine bacterium B5-7]
MSKDRLSASVSARALAENGAFAKQFKDFRARLAQQEMALEVERAIRDKHVLVAESGTGTGKTFAYLVPALLSGGRVIVSTGTRHLQDQLFLNDLPAVKKILGTPNRTERLKGRSNYLCLYRLDQSDSLLFNDRNEGRQLDQIRDWSKKTTSGDISEVPGIADDASIWPSLTTQRDNCLGTKCDFIDDCFVYKARRRAMAADLVVVNHHLFFSDIALKDEGFGEVLPQYDCVIFDEAHLIPETASQFFGFGFGSNAIRNLCREIQVAEAADKSGVVMDAALIDVERAVNGLVLSVKPEQRGDLSELLAVKEFRPAIDKLRSELAALGELLDNAAVAGAELELVRDRCQSLAASLEPFIEMSGDDMVYWYETGKRSLRLQATPISVASLLGERLLKEPMALVFTSATLCSDDSGQHFRRAVGLDDDTHVKIWHSPYDYAQRALLYVPEGMPDPSNSSFAEKMLERIVPILTAARGRAFVLFTSYRMMHEVHGLLDAKGLFPLMLQGDASRHRLIEAFRQSDNAVLFGTSSFWEGVDVKGDDLICVIIDKLPFSSPFDPVNRARLKHIEDNGGNSFAEYLLPRAVLNLKQGAGRLIRDEADYGVLMICDPRIVQKNYGRAFLDALPPMRKTRREEIVVRFLRYFDRVAETA